MNIFMEILKVNFYMSIIILLSLIFKKKLIEKYTATFSYILYIGILLRLICFIKIKISLPSSSAKEYLYNSNSLNYISNVSHKVQDSVKTLNIIDMVYYVWIVGCIFGLIYFIYYNVKFYNNIRFLQKEIIRESITSILENQKVNLKVKRNIKLYILDGIYSPMLVGILKPKLILPSKYYKEEELEFIFKHELIHYKRKDNLWKLLISLVNIVYWFNPIIYLFRKGFNEQCELSCDELVIKNSSINEIKTYSLMLLETVKYKNKLNTLMCASQFNFNKVNIIKTRIEKMLSFEKRKKGLLVGGILCIIAFSSLVSFTMKSEIKVDDYPYLSEYIQKDPEDLSENEQNNIAAKIQAYELKKLGVTKKISELTEEEKRFIIENMMKESENELRERYASDIVKEERKYNYFSIELKDGSRIGASINEEQFFEDYSNN